MPYPSLHLLGNIGKSNLIVGDALDGSGVSLSGLDADTCFRFSSVTCKLPWRSGFLTIDGGFDLVVVEGHSIHGVVTATANTADRQSVSTGANTVLESNVLQACQSLSRRANYCFWTYRAGVHSNTVILVVHVRTSDNDTSTVTNIESIGIGTQVISITRFVVDGHISDRQSITSIDTDSLDGCVLDVEVRDCRVGEIMGIEELGLGHTTIASFAVPPAGSITVEVRISCTLDGDASAGDLEQGSVPFFVTPGCLTFEDDLSNLVSTRDRKIAFRFYIR